MHHLGVPLMVSLEGRNSLLPILGPIPHPNGTALQFIGLSGKRMRLEVMHHLKFVFDITEEQIGRRQRIGRFIAAVVLQERRLRAMLLRAWDQRMLRGRCDRACGVDR